MDLPTGSIKYEMAFLYKQENAYILLSAVGPLEPTNLNGCIWYRISRELPFRTYMEREPSPLQMNNTENSLAVPNLEAYAGSTKDINGKASPFLFVYSQPIGQWPWVARKELANIWCFIYYSKLELKVPTVA